MYCPPGYYEVGNGTCEPCPVGTYQPDEGSTECVKCPYRVSSTEPGAVRESHCSDICEYKRLTSYMGVFPKFILLQLVSDPRYM